MVFGSDNEATQQTTETGTVQSGRTRVYGLYYTGTATA